MNPELGISGKKENKVRFDDLEMGVTFCFEVIVILKYKKFPMPSHRFMTLCGFNRNI